MKKFKAHYKNSMDGFELQLSKKAEKESLIDN